MRGIVASADDMSAAAAWRNRFREQGGKISEEARMYGILQGFKEPKVYRVCHYLCLIGVSVSNFAREP